MFSFYQGGVEYQFECCIQFKELLMMIDFIDILDPHFIEHLKVQFSWGEGTITRALVWEILWNIWDLKGINQKEVLEPFWTIMVFPMFYVLETRIHHQGASQVVIRMISEQSCEQPHRNL